MGIRRVFAGFKRQTPLRIFFQNKDYSPALGESPIKLSVFLLLPVFSVNKGLCVFRTLKFIFKPHNDQNAFGGRASPEPRKGGGEGFNRSLQNPTYATE